MALGILQHFDVASLKVDGADSLHLQIEAMKLAFADARRYVGDIDTMDVRPQQLLEPGYLKSRAALIDIKRAQDFAMARRRRAARSISPRRMPRDDGVLHPVQLHGVRLGRGRERHLAAEPGREFRHDERPSQSGRPAQTPLPDDHPASSQRTASR